MARLPGMVCGSCPRTGGRKGLPEPAAAAPAPRSPGPTQPHRAAGGPHQREQMGPPWRSMDVVKRRFPRARCNADVM